MSELRGLEMLERNRPSRIEMAASSSQETRRHGDSRLVFVEIGIADIRLS
jgi:hypothetical protein